MTVQHNAVVVTGQDNCCIVANHFAMLRGMITRIKVYAWKCLECKGIWMSDKKPSRCPKRGCGALATYKRGPYKENGSA